MLPFGLKNAGFLLPYIVPFLPFMGGLLTDNLSTTKLYMNKFTHIHKSIGGRGGIDEKIIFNAYLA